MGNRLIAAITFSNQATYSNMSKEKGKKTADSRNLDIPVSKKSSKIYKKHRNIVGEAPNFPRTMSFHLGC